MDAATFLLLSGSSGGGGGGGKAPALSVDGQFFRSHGERWTSIATSEFSILKRYLEGEDIRPILDERCAVGFNELRIWSLNESVVGQVYAGGIQPKQYADFYERSRACWELIGTYGLAIENTVFTSCIPLMTNVDDQQTHWMRSQGAASGLGHVRLELVNEYDWGKGENSPDRSLWSMRPVGIIASSGSAVAGAQTATPVWDYGSYHSNGLSEWQRKCAHNAMEDVADAFKIPGTANENTRFPDDEQSTERAYDAASGAALLSAGACFHSQSGKYSRLFDPIERDCAKAWCDGARSVPLEFQAGVYGHPQELEDHVNKTVLRAYTRTLSDGRSHLVLIHY
jgi:hypothetical protein